MINPTFNFAAGLDFFSSFSFLVPSLSSVLPSSIAPSTPQHRDSLARLHTGHGTEQPGRRVNHPPSYPQPFCVVKRDFVPGLGAPLSERSVRFLQNPKREA